MKKPIYPQNSTQNDTTLFFGVNKKGEIIQFDKKCQNITGYQREEVLNREIWDELIPESHITKWKQMIDQVVQSQHIENIQMPWKTANGTEITVTWNSYPINNKDPAKETYLFVGQPQPSQKQPPPKELPTPNLHPSTLETSRNPSTEHQNKSPLTTNQEKTEKNNQSIPQTQKTNNTPSTTDAITVNKTLETLQTKYAAMEYQLKELEKKDYSLEKHNERLEKTIKQLTYEKSAQKQEPRSSIMNQSDEESTLPKFNRFFHRKKYNRAELTEKIQWIKRKTQELESKEQGINEKERLLDRKIAELRQWKEKLIELETEITKRQDFLHQIEKQSQEKISKSPLQSITQESLNEYSTSAAVIQRGLFKAINVILTETFGYDHEELTGKSFYDLIAPEGLAQIEQFHLDRLKGKASSEYSTVFMNKNHEKIPVKIQFNAIIFDDQKADIALIAPKQTEIIHQNQEDDSVQNQNTKEELDEIEDQQENNNDERESKSHESTEPLNMQDEIVKDNDVDPSEDALVEKIEEAGE
jgi:PAS domain S-box-containing protein